MTEFLLFGGTSEGRNLARRLASLGARVTYCVATGYGAALAPDCPGVLVHTGRLDEAGMAALMTRRPYACVVDATHPYAAEVTRNLRAAAGRAGLACFRLVREGAAEGEGWLHAPGAAEAARLLHGLPGNVLLTTGSKDLNYYAVPGLRERVFPRVLPSLDSLQKCLDLGFPPAHILCMQGPFSAALNLALMEQHRVKTLVTKASGGAGGFWEKAEAARGAGAALLVIDRPVREDGCDYDTLLALLEAMIGEREQ